eukprot:TRINITY_DN878_c0_g1_i2.p1 TRINITY_DN878_c0_g1~~TRINITY_DN878_c0_g1_i2.p1  ORF type:complete len:225 (+),score=70.35 TRINITY_DN878_c0_g1_i2:187-861(+)
MYYIFVTSYGTATGLYVIDIFEEETNRNFECVSSTEITTDAFVDTNNIMFATPSSGDCWSGTRQGAWYHVFALNQIIDVSTCSPLTDFMTDIRVFRGCDHVRDTGTSCNTTLVPDLSCYPQSHLQIWGAAVDGKEAEFWIFVSGANDQVGTFFLTVVKSTFPNPPHHLSGGAVAGIVIAVLFVCAAAIGGLVYLYYLNKHKGYVQLPALPSLPIIGATGSGVKV